MIARLLQRLPPHEISHLALLAGAIACLVNGLGTAVQGAAISVFLPAGLLAALLGWGLANSRLNGWLVTVSLIALGGLLLWVSTAQLGGLMLQVVNFTFFILIADIYHLRGGPAPDWAPLQSVFETIGQQSAVLWHRLLVWVTSIWLNQTSNDAVVRVMVWSLTVWLVCAWAGWAIRRRDAITALTPALVILALVTSYTGLEINSVWLLLIIMLALLGLGRYSANLRAWKAHGVDYAEIISFNTLFAVTCLTMALATCAWVLPNIPIKDLIDHLRRPTSETTAQRALGLVEAPKESVSSSFGESSLPRSHLIKAGPHLSQDLVFTVRTGELPRLPVDGPQLDAPYHHWRSQAYDLYNGYGWSTSETEKQTLPAGDALFTTLPNGYRRLDQEFSIYHPGDRIVYWAGALYRLDQTAEAAWRKRPILNSPVSDLPFNDGDLFGALHETAGYHVEAYLPNASVEQLRAAGQDYPASIRARYLTLPPNISERVYGLARQLTATAATPYDQATAIETYLRTNYPYTLDLPAPPIEVEIADYFLFELKKGYCDYYATAMAVLARASGLPARLVTGYASGKYDMRNAEYIVSEADAHAWVEIYFPGLGWIEFEPTANQPVISRPTAQAGRGPSASLPTPSAFQLLKQTYASLPPLARWAVTIPSLLLLLALVYAILEDFILKQLPPTLALRWIFRDIYRLGGRLAGQPTPATTVTEFCAALVPQIPDQTSIQLLAETYLQALFSPTPVSRRQVRRAIQAWHTLRWRLIFTRKI